MGRFLVGVGLVVMLSAVAFFATMQGDATATAQQVDSAVSSAVWIFLAGTMIAIFGGVVQPRSGR